MNARFVSTAELELNEAMEFYESARAGLGAEFLSEVEAATKLIEIFPQAWLPLSSRTRRCRTHLFPYGLFYQVRDKEILIVSAMDLRRDPKSWEKHL